MNFNALYKKYCNDCETIVHDRTYDGLFIVNGHKPSLPQFEAWQEQEDQISRAEGRQAEDRISAVQLKQIQARAKALYEIRPFEERLLEIESEEKKLAINLKADALEVKSLMRRKEVIEDSWKEISEAQEISQKEAQKFLDDSAFYLSWDPDKIPKEIKEKREIAHKRLLEGQVVFSDWRTLRQKELPSREELAEAIRTGGEHLERIKAICRDVSLRFPKPKRTY